MAHAGTMVGGSAQTKQSGSPWPAIALTVAVVAATITGVWLASSAGLAGGTAKSAADRSFDQIEAQRGAVTLSSDRSRSIDVYLNGILDRAHATPYAVTLSSDAYLNSILDRAHATPYAVTLSSDAYLNSILDRAHATPYVDDAVRLPLSATSGTFHPGWKADPLMAQAKRDRVGGP